MPRLSRIPDSHSQRIRYGRSHYPAIRLPYPRHLLGAQALSTTATMRGGRSGPYSLKSFAIEPIQLPIVPLSPSAPSRPFRERSLHTTAARERAASTGLADGLRGGGPELRTDNRGP